MVVKKKKSCGNRLMKLFCCFRRGISRKPRNSLLLFSPAPSSSLPSADDLLIHRVCLLYDFCRCSITAGVWLLERQCLDSFLGVDRYVSLFMPVIISLCLLTLIILNFVICVNFTLISKSILSLNWNAIAVIIL